MADSTYIKPYFESVGLHLDRNDTLDQSHSIRRLYWNTKE